MNAVTPPASGPRGPRPGPGRRRRLAHYLVPVLAVAAATGLWWALRPVVGQDPPLVLLGLAVVASAWVGGVGPGMVATGLATTVAAAAFARPSDGLEPTLVGAGLRVAALAVLGVAVSVLSELRHGTAARAAALAEEHARALLESQERYRRIVETAAEGVWEIDAQGRTTYANRRMAEMLGLARPEDLLGRSAFDFVAPEEREEARAAWVERLAGQRGSLETRLVGADGRARWFRTTASPLLDADGATVGASALFMDTTEAREAADALRRAAARRGTELAVVRALAEAATREEAFTRVLGAICSGLGWDVGAIWFVDEEANVLRCASVWRQEGVEAAEFASATLRRALSPGVGLPGLVWTSQEPAWIEDVLATPNFARGVEAAAAGLHGAFAFPVTLGAHFLGVMEFFSRERRPPDQDLIDGIAPLGSQIGQFVGRKSGEEERARLLEREQAARREAEAANRAKDEFLSTLSHELRTPLNAIVGWAHLLRSGQLDEKNTARAVDVIDRNARAQSQMISDVLDVSRIVTGRLKLDVRRVDARAIVEEALSSVESAARGKGIRVETEFDADDAPVSADADRLRQVVWNLLANAVKFTPQGGSVGVALRRQPSAIEVQVSDSGVGIEPEFLPHVFERFRQRDSSPTRAHGGLGLGLALVRHLVELHGGTVKAESEGPGRGARFTVRLPIHVVDAERPVEPAGDPRPEPTAIDGAPAPPPEGGNGMRAES